MGVVAMTFAPLRSSTLLFSALRLCDSVEERCVLVFVTLSVDVLFIRLVFVVRDP